MATLKGTLKGIIPAVLTPLKADGAPDTTKLAAHCRWLLARGSDGLGIFGTTGEANSFSVAERVQTLESLAAAGIPGSVMMPGTGACAVPDAVELTRAALKAGAAGVLMLPAFYYKNPSDEGSRGVFRRGDREGRRQPPQGLSLPLPQMATVPVSFGVIERLLKSLPRHGGRDEGQLGRFREHAPRRASLRLRRVPRRRPSALSDAEGRRRGAITACANIVSELAEVHRGFLAGRDVAAAHEAVGRPRRPVQIPLSAGLEGDHGGNHRRRILTRVRPPLKALTQAERAEQLKALAIGFALPKAA